MSINLYHTQRIRGFQQEEVKYSGRVLTYKLKKSRFYCHQCGSQEVKPEIVSRRQVHGEPSLELHV